MFWAPVTAVTRRIPCTAARRPTRAATVAVPMPLPLPRADGARVADLDTALAVGRAVGAQIANDRSVSAADDEPDGWQHSGRAGVDVADGRAHGLGDPVVQGSFLELARDRSAVEHGLGDAASDRPEPHASGLDGPPALPVSGAWTCWLCHGSFPPATLPA